MRKKKKTKKFFVRRMMAVLVLVFLIFGIRNGMYAWKQKCQMKKVRLVWNQEAVQLLNPMYIEDTVLYLSEEDVKAIFDDTIYYNKGDEELITTYYKHVAVLQLNENAMLLNDVSLPMKGLLKEMEAKLYLPISDLETVYDMEMEYHQTTNLVTMDSKNKAKKRAMLLKNVKIKEDKLPFAITVEKGKRGDEVYCLEESGRYQKVRTSSRKSWLGC